MFRKSLLLLAALLLIAAPFASSQAPLPFNTSTLVNPGDTAHFGSYQVIKIATGIYQISDPGDPKAKMAGLIGTDIYVINGAAKALIIDLGNNYIDGYKADEIPPPAPTPPSNCAPSLLASSASFLLKSPSPTPIPITPA